MPKPTSDCRATERKHPWPMVRLGDVCDEIKDRIQSSKISVGEYVTTDNMVKDRGGIVPAEYVPSDVGLVEYHKDDVLIANIRPYLKKIWLADHDGGCSSDVVVFRSNIDGLSSEYLYSVLSQDAYFEYVMQKPRGTKMPRGDRDWMKEFRFPLPPLSVQREIVARLERELAAVEKIKKDFEALAETAKAEFKAELKEVFEEISRGGAETRRLGDTFRFIDYRGMTPNKIATGVPLITAKNIRFGYMDYRERFYISEEDYAKRQTRGVARCGDILFTTEAPMGYVALADQKRFSTGQRIITFQWPNATEHNNRYFLYYFMSDVFQDQVRENASGATAQGIKSSRLVNLSVLIPECQKQSQVVARLDSAKARAEKLEAKAREGVAVCETMRKAILKEAFAPCGAGEVAR